MKEFRRRWSLLTKKEKYIVYSILGGVVIFLALGLSVFSMRSSDQEESIENGTLPTSEEREVEEAPKRNVSPLSGEECERYDQRPIGVMVASDPAARPLSGVNQAEIVVEMPVVSGSVTRLMAVFVCDTPEEVGSIRSARHDFTSLIRGWDALFVHWGGSSFALDELSTGVRYTGENLGPVDNINALNADRVFFRKNTVPAPHNGFASLPNALEYSERQGYRLDNPDFEPYLFLTPSQIEEQLASAQAGTVYVGYSGVYSSRWEYNLDTNTYARFWANQRDVDALDEEGVSANNVIVMKAESRQIQDQYNTVNIYGEGEARVYQNGQEVGGTWKKDGFKGTIRFVDAEGEEIALVPGQTYIQIIEPNQNVNWEPDSISE